MHRTKFFLALTLLLVAPLLLYKSIWLIQSRTIDGVFAFEGRGNALEQIRFPHSEIWFKIGNDSFWLRGPGNLGLKSGDIVPVRYLPGNPANAKLDTFLAIWGGTVIYGGIPLLILLVIFLHPEIVPYRSKVMLIRKKPFLKVV